MNLITHTLLKPLMVGAVVSLIPLTAQGPRHAEKPRHEEGRGFDIPGLTEAQRTSLKAIAEKHKAALETKRKAEREAEEAFRKAMEDPATKDADLKAAFEKASQARLASILEQHALMQESAAVLTAEQKAELQKHRPEGTPPRHEGPGPRRGGMPPHHGEDGPEAPEGPEDFPGF